MQNLNMISPVTESAQMPNPESIQLSSNEIKSEHSTPSPPGLDKPEPTAVEFNSQGGNLPVRQSPEALSPETSKQGFPTPSTPQPPPLDLSSLPTSPVRSNPESLMGADTHTVGKSANPSPGSILKSCANAEDDGNCPAPVLGLATHSPASATSDDTVVHNKPNNLEWLEAMQQYGQAAQAMKLNLNLINGLDPLSLPDFKQIAESNNNNNNNMNVNSSSNNSNASSNNALSPAEFTTRFQNMLSNLSQFIFNAQLPNLNKNSTSQKSPSPNKLNDPQSTPKSQIDFGDPLGTPPVTSMTGNLSSPNMLNSPLGTNLPNPSNDFNANSQSLALTASVLGLLTAQKQNGFQNMILDPNFTCPLKPYTGPCSSSSSSSTASTVSCPSSQFHPVSTTSPLSSMGFPGTDSIRGPDCKLPDPRDLLYQLGQQLMAMATSPNVGQLLPGQMDLWNPSINDFKFMPPTSFAPNSSAFLSPSLNHPMNPSLMPNTGGLNCIPNTGLDKGLGHLNTGSVPFSGISMRGNQKYSAYYQHQRKQTFQGSVSNDSGVSSSLGRRQRNSLSPMSGTRYGSRRLRSGTTNLPVGSSMLEPRTAQRFPGLRTQTSGQVQGVGTPCQSGATMFPNFRTNTPYKFTGLAPNAGGGVSTPKGGTTTDPNSLGQSATNVSTSPVSARHRETAFLCSCGKDFDSLYVFTLHMKDTGHKPKSDQAERDIPKLVRGQDMWINSETEQTREILRCMRCHQSFRSLPELTMHMMKTNHYSEIVYNDSGRCVFVNPEEPRRGTAVSSSVSSPGKPSALWSGSSSGRRSGRQSNANWLNGLPSNSTHERLPNAEESNSNATAATPASKTLGSSLKTSAPVTTEEHEEPTKKSRLEAGKRHESRETIKWEDDNKLESDESKPKEEDLSKSPIQSRPSSSASLATNSLRNEEFNNSNSDIGHMFTDSSNEPVSGKSSGSVLQQIESFVENSLPRPGKILTTKPEASDHSSNRSGSPRSVNSGSEIPSNHSHSYSPASSRKRTFSEATGSGTFSPTPSPVQDNDIVMKDVNASNHSADPKRQPTLHSTSPTSIKVSSTSEINSNLVENPLSSLQKLVETTHKPVRSSLAFSVPTSSPLFTGYANSSAPTKNFNASKQLGMNNNNGNSTSNNGNNYNSSLRSPYSPSKSGSNTAPGSPYTSSANSSTNRLQTSSLSPPREGDNIVPALSALYAYVERSSNSQLVESQNGPKDELSSPSISDSIKTTNSLTGSDKAGDETVGHETISSTSPNLNSSAPVLQAIYAAALSNLASQCLNTQNSELPKVSSANDPLNAFKSAALNFKDALDSFGLRDLQNIEMTQQWLTMLRNVIESTTKSDSNPVNQKNDPRADQSSNEIQNMNSRNSNISNPESNPMNERLFEEHNPGDTRPQTSPNSKVSISPPLSSRSNNSPCNEPVHLTPNTPIRASYPLGNLPTSNPNSFGTNNCNMQTSINATINNPLVSGALPNPLATMPHSTYSNTGSRPIAQTGNSSMMSTITKKAKCHFCGKPFANKGQVRLHISKNKCPCLLQQSCHAAALAAAFSSNTQRMSHSLNSKTDLTNTGIHSTMNRISNTNDGLQDLTMSSRQLKVDDHNSMNHNSSGNAPSALSLLKERFQNFDVNQNFSLNPDFASTSSATTTTGDYINSINPAFSKQSNMWMSQNLGSMLPVQPSSKTNSANPSTAAAAAAAAAANAGHLAAMALLAQTLVQLTANQPQPLAPQSLQQQQQSPAQVSNVFDSLAELSNSVGMPFLAPGLPPRGIQTSGPSESPNIQDPNLNFNLDNFMQQVNLAKQLASVGWVPNAPVSSVPSNPDDSQTHHYTFGHVQGNRATAPNGLS